MDNAYPGMKDGLVRPMHGFSFAGSVMLVTHTDWLGDFGGIQTASKSRKGDSG
jgi:enterochelin esterase-like enzyme